MRRQKYVFLALSVAFLAVIARRSDFGAAIWLVLGVMLVLAGAALGAYWLHRRRQTKRFDDV